MSACLKKHKKYRKYYFIALLAAVLILLPERVAHASIFDLSLEYIFANLVFIIFTIVGKIIAALATGLNYVIHIPVYPEGGIAVIDASWKIMRNFANMFFVVVLIVMAFATIFNITNYEARKLFPKFLIAAVLINFSLVIGGLVIDGSQILSNTFLVSIGDMGNRLGESLNPSKLLPASSADIETFVRPGQGVEQSVPGSIIQLVFSVILAFTFLLSLLTAFLFAFIRIPILWALLVVSPIAWILSILPAMQGTYKKWWSLFIGWNLFLPIFLFFLYFSLYFLQNQGAVMAAIASQTKDQKMIGFTTFQDIFFYALASVFLIGGTMTAMKAAMKSAMFANTGVETVAKFVRKGIADRIGLTAAGRAARGRYEEYAEGRETRVQRQTSFMRDTLGKITGGRIGFKEEQQAKDIAAGKKKFERITDPEQLRNLMGKGPVRDQLAVREIMKERGLLGNNELKETFNLYGGNGTLAGKQFASSINYEKLTPDQRKEWFSSIIDVGTKQKILGIMADKGDGYLTKDSEGAKQNLEAALKLYSLEGEQRDLLKKIEKHNLEMAIDLQIERKMILGADKKPITDPAEAIAQIMQKMKPDDILEATKTLTAYAKRGVQNRERVLNSLNQQKIEAMMAKGTREQLEDWKNIAPEKFDEDRIRAEKERVARELAGITGKASGEAIARELNRGNSESAGGGGAPPSAGPGSTTPPGNVIDLRNK